MGTVPTDNLPGFNGEGGTDQTAKEWIFLLSAGKPQRL